MKELELVQDLNNFLYDHHENLVNEGFSFQYSSTGYSDVILFNDFIIWSSDNDDTREWNEEKQDYKLSLEDHIKNLFIKYLKNLDILRASFEKENNSIWKG